MKGIFLPLAFVLMLVALVALLAKRRSAYPIAVSLMVFVVLAAPYSALLSRYYGHFTLGESGQLNYAFHVNYLPRWTNWQGGPPEDGRPIHPTHQVLANPDLFIFAEPYHNTYPPFGNVVYWYEGYRHFWSAKYQAIAIARNLFYLSQIFVEQPIFWAVLLSAGLLFAEIKEKREWRNAVLKLWVFYVPALFGITLYVQVHLEDRYLGSFLAILCLAPFVSAAMLRRMPSRKTQSLVLLVMALGATVNYAFVDRDVFAHMLHHYTYVQNPQWKLGLALQRAGFKPGDEIGKIGGPNASCTWAYMDHLRIAAELGGEPYNPRHFIPGESEKVVSDFWHSSPALQGKILALFHQAGVVAVLAPDKPPNVAAPPGWHEIENTGTWDYRFR
jgi:hypothetical protein